MTLTVRRYSNGEADSWNAFVHGATNATFLHDRGFMDYHADRFEDFSLVVEQEDKPIAILPANRSGDVVQSHGGLTYGGLLVPPRLPAATIIDAMTAIGTYLRDAAITRLIYKPAPHIFHLQPAEADLYALINAGARQVRADLGAAIPLRRRTSFNKLRQRSVRKARKSGLTVAENRDFATFWDILNDVLGSRHDAKPTHSLDEITRLAGTFPDRIRLFASHSGDRMLAGVLMFDCGHCVHAQYIAAAPEGRDLGALDLLVHALVTEVFADREWFSFGISTTNAGRDLNIGLSRQKEMFGGHSVMFSQYQWDLT